eukprot:2569506-Pleurochrysis_carterae.AAC.1
MASHLSDSNATGKASPSPVRTATTTPKSKDVEYASFGSYRTSIKVVHSMPMNLPRIWDMGTTGRMVASSEINFDLNAPTRTGGL